MIPPLGYRGVLALAACLMAMAPATGAAAVQSPLATATSQPAARPAARPDLSTRLQWRIDGRVEALDSPDPQHCAQAQDDILHLQQILLKGLSRNADSEDLEIRLRVRELIGEMATDTRVWRILFKLPLDQRAKVLLLRRRRPDWFNAILSPSWSRRILAVKQLSGPGSDPGHLAEPFLILLLRHPSADLVAATVEAITAGQYRSDATIDALAAMVVKHWRRNPTWQRQSSRHSSFNPRAAALEALADLPSRRAAPQLLSLLRAGDVTDRRSNIRLAEAIGASGELRAIDALVKRLGRTSARHTWRVNKVRGGTTDGDYSFLALLRLTSQSPAAYDFLHLDYYGTTHVGFASNAIRRKAYAKFKKWWRANGGNPPYKGLKPLAPPEDTPPTGQARPAAAGPSRPARAPVDVEALHEDLSARVDELAAKLGAQRLRDRMRAHAALLALYRAYLGHLIAHADRASAAVRSQLFDILTDAVAAARLREAQASLPPAAWKRLEDVQRRSPLILRDAFSLSWKRRVRAMDTARRMAASGDQAAPLVLRGLRDPMPQVVMAAAKAAQTGAFSSDEVVKALTNVLIQTPQNAWYNDWPGSYANPSRARPHVAAADALGKIKNPRSAEVLLSLLVNGRSTNVYRDAALGKALGQTGDRRAIPPLASRLGQTRIIQRWGGRGAMTMAPSDVFLLALVRLTGQDPKQYKFQKAPYDRPLYGFQETAQRKAAIGKFKAWWRQHRSSPRYRNIKPIQVRKLRK